MTDEVKENIAVNAVRNYLNCDFTDEEIKTKYGYVIDLIKAKDIDKIISNVNSRVGISSKTEGSRSISYNNSTSTIDYLVDDVIKGLLPRPFIRLY